MSEKWRNIAKTLIPWPGIEPGPRRWERRILTTRPPGTLLQMKHQIQLNGYIINMFMYIIDNFWGIVDAICYKTNIFVVYEHFHDRGVAIISKNVLLINSL